jgi:hypothetical protein
MEGLFSTLLPRSRWRWRKAGMGHEGGFAPLKLSTGCGFRKETITATARRAGRGPRACALGAAFIFVATWFALRRAMAQRRDNDALYPRLRQNSAARRAQRCGCSRLTPWPTPATASILPFGSVLAKICCCAEAIGLLSPLSSKTGATMRGSSGTVSTSSKQSCIAAAISGGVRSISRTTQSHKSFRRPPRPIGSRASVGTTRPRHRRASRPTRWPCLARRCA